MKWTRIWYGIEEMKLIYFQADTATFVNFGEAFVLLHILLLQLCFVIAVIKEDME